MTVVFSRYLLLHIVQDVFEVQVIVVVFDPFSYTALKQGGRLTEGRGARRYPAAFAGICRTGEADLPSFRR